MWNCEISTEDTTAYNAFAEIIDNIITFATGIGNYQDLSKANKEAFIRLGDETSNVDPELVEPRELLYLLNYIDTSERFFWIPRPYRMSGDYELSYLAMEPKCRKVTCLFCGLTSPIHLNNSEGANSYEKMVLTTLSTHCGNFVRERIESWVSEVRTRENPPIYSADSDMEEGIINRTTPADLRAATNNPATTVLDKIIRHERGCPLVWLQQSTTIMFTGKNHKYPLTDVSALEFALKMINTRCPTEEEWLEFSVLCGSLHTLGACEDTLKELFRILVHLKQTSTNPITHLKEGRTNLLKEGSTNSITHLKEGRTNLLKEVSTNFIKGGRTNLLKEGSENSKSHLKHIRTNLSTTYNSITESTERDRNSFAKYNTAKHVVMILATSQPGPQLFENNRTDNWEEDGSINIRNEPDVRTEERLVYVALENRNKELHQYNLRSKMSKRKGRETAAGNKEDVGPRRFIIRNDKLQRLVTMHGFLVSRNSLKWENIDAMVCLFCSYMFDGLVPPRSVLESYYEEKEKRALLNYINGRSLCEYRKYNGAGRISQSFISKHGANSATDQTVLHDCVCRQPGCSTSLPAAFPGDVMSPEAIKKLNINICNDDIRPVCMEEEDEPMDQDDVPNYTLSKEKEEESIVPNYTHSKGNKEESIVPNYTLSKEKEEESIVPDYTLSKEKEEESILHLSATLDMVHSSSCVFKFRRQLFDRCCMVCWDITELKLFTCGHFMCSECYNDIRVTKCPLCKRGTRCERIHHKRGLEEFSEENNAARH